VNDVPKWEDVSGSVENGELTKRLRVPGGWLYRLNLWTEEHESIAMAFVPDAAIQREERAVYERAVRAETKVLHEMFPPPENVPR